MAKVFKEDKPWIVSKPWRAEVNTADFTKNNIGLVVENFRTKKAATKWAEDYEAHCRSVAKISADRDATEVQHAHR